MAARGIDITGVPFGNQSHTPFKLIDVRSHLLYIHQNIVINVTLPDDKQNYIHRIGRVGRADRMGLAISLVATVKEKVTYIA